MAEGNGLSEKKRLSDDFTQGSIIGKLIKFMIPILGALVLQAMYGAVDLLVVGKFGTDTAISAVATGGNVVNLVTFIITGLTMGVTILISRYIGEGKNHRIGKVIGGAICFFLCLAAFLTGIMLIFAPAFASLLQVPQEAYELTIVYIRICGAGIVFRIWNCTEGSCIRYADSIFLNAVSFNYNCTECRCRKRKESKTCNGDRNVIWCGNRCLCICTCIF